MKVKYRFAAIWLCGLLLALLGWQPARAQTVNLSAAQVNRIVYVAIALNRLDAINAPEKIALVAFVNKAYAANPNANPGTILRFMARAQERYDLLYDSKLRPAQPRYTITPFDSTGNMLSILSTQTGNPVAAGLANDSVNLGTTLIGSRLGGDNSYLETSSVQARTRAVGGFDTYRQTQLENLHTLASGNAKAASVVNTFFGTLFNARIGETTAQLLAKNPVLRDSQNFAPFVSLINVNGAISVARTSALTGIANFQNQMNTVVTSGTATLGNITAIQKPNYAQYFLNPNDLARPLVTQWQSVNAPKLEGSSAAAYALPFTIESDPRFEQYKISRASLNVAAKAAQFTGTLMEATAPGSLVLENGAPIAYAVAAGLEMAGAIMDLSAVNGDFGKPDDEIIMDGIGKLSSQLNQIQVQINGRLDIIDANIINLYNTMNDQFANVVAVLNNITSTLGQIQEEVRGLQTNVLRVQSSLDRLTQNIYEFAQDEVRFDLKDALVLIDLYDRQDSNIADFVYNALYSKTLTHATDIAVNDSREVGPSAATRPNDDYSDYGIEGVFATLPNPEWQINYILEFARRRFNLRVFSTDAQNFVQIQPLIPAGSRVANPRAWEMSVGGMMRLASLAPQFFRDTTINDSASGGQGFFGARNVGRALQNAVANVTLEGSNKSALISNLLRFQQIKAIELRNALSAIEADEPASPSNTYLQRVVARVRTEWVTPNTPPGSTALQLQTAAKALQGSRLMLNAFLNFGLSRSLESVDLLRSLIYSPQRLPDKDLVKALYDSWTPVQPYPGLVFDVIQSERWLALSELLDNILNNIVAENRNGSRVGEPLTSVEIIMRRFDFFTLTRVQGKVRPATGGFIPGEPIYLTFRSDDAPVEIPVMLDANNNFEVMIPEGSYDLAIRADRFLRAVIPGVATTRGNIPSTNNPITIDVQLKIGDLNNDNVVDNRDQILIRNAWGQQAFNPNWNPAADINGSGSVDVADLLILIAAYNSTPVSLNWNPVADINGSGAVDVADLLILIAAYNTSGQVNPNFNILCDLNNDNVINNADLLLLRANWGQRGDD